MFVDTDYSLDMLRLVSILDRRLSAGTHAHTHTPRGPWTSGPGSDPEHLLLHLLHLSWSFTSQPVSLSWLQLALLAPPLLRPCCAPASLASWWSTAPPLLSSSSPSTSWRRRCRHDRVWLSSSSTASLLSIGWTAVRAEPASPGRRRNSASVRSCWPVCSGTGAGPDRTFSLCPCCAPGSSQFIP